MKILLISGHGAGDPGANGNGHKEADLTRELVNLIAPKLRGYATVDVYNQNRNAFKDCENGTFNIGAYDYVLEVHFNAFNGKAYGTEIYVTSRETATTVEQKIMDKMGKFFSVRGVKVTDFLVINTVKSKGISSALIETCFIDNATDMKVYEGSKNQIADAIVNGIAEGFGLKKTSGGSADKPAKPQPPKKKTISEIAKEVINGKWGNGAEREKKLKEAGYNYNEVQEEVNRQLGISDGVSGNSYFPKAPANETSIVDYMKEKCGYKSVTFADQQKVAKVNGISNYTGTASQNIKLLDLAKKGKLVKP